MHRGRPRARDRPHGSSNVAGMSAAYATHAESHSLESLTDLKRRRFEACDALQRRTRQPLVFARSDALELLAVEKPIEPESERRRTDMDVVVPDQNDKGRIKGIRFLTWHGLIKTITIGRSIECTSPVCTWAHYGGILSLRELIVLGDSMMRRDGRLTRATPDDFRSYLESAGGFHGIRNCKRALSLMRENTDSSQETRTRLVPMLFGLPEPEVNVMVRLPDGRAVFLDMAYPDLRIAIEYDGGYHRFSGAQVLSDDQRREALESMGWIYIKVTVLSLRTEDGEERLAQRIASAIEAVLGVPVPLRPRMTVRQICDGRRHTRKPVWENVPRRSWRAPWAATATTA